MATFTTYYDLAKPAVNSPVDEDVWGSELNDNMDIIDAALHAISTSGASGTPIGSVQDYAGSTEPSGWLFCFGQAISRATYSDLFAVVGITYGVGDGSTTFNLPDCRGRVSAGKDNMGGTSADRLTNSPTGGVDGDVLGGTGGLQGHILTVPQLATFTPTGTAASVSGSGTLTINTTDETAAGGVAGVLMASNPIVGSGVNLERGFNATTPPNFTHTVTTVTVPVTGLTGALTMDPIGSSASHNNVQPTIILNKIIKYAA